MGAPEWTKEEIEQIKEAISNRGTKTVADLAGTLQLTLGRPYRGVYIKVRKVLHELEGTSSAMEQVELEGRSFTTFIKGKIFDHENRAKELKALLGEYERFQPTQEQ